MPSHIQVERVLEGTLDAAIAWAPPPRTASMCACCGRSRCRGRTRWLRAGGSLPAICGSWWTPTSPPGTRGTAMPRRSRMTPAPRWSTSTTAASRGRDSMSAACGWNAGARVAQAPSGAPARRAAHRRGPRPDARVVLVAGDAGRRRPAGGQRPARRRGVADTRRRAPRPPGRAVVDAARGSPARGAALAAAGRRRAGRGSAGRPEASDPQRSGGALAVHGGRSGRGRFGRRRL